MQSEAPALELRGITKRFGPVVANDGIDFDLRPGEVHALLGENGAGKSTLMSILYGLYSPTEGEIRVNGEQVEVDSPSRAIDLGIGMVHQHFMLVPVMTVTENIVLGEEPTRGALLDVREGSRKVKELSDRYGLAVDPDAVIEQVSVGMQQRVEILKTLYRDARILILDEPTAVLTAQESHELFEVLRALKKDGVSIVFISHKLNEVLEISDRVTVLRRGKRIDTVPTEGATEASLARLMVGRDVLLRVEKETGQAGRAGAGGRGPPRARRPRARGREGRVARTSAGARWWRSPAWTATASSSSCRRSRACACRSRAACRSAARDVTGRGVRETTEAGVAHIPEDRHLCGLVLDFTLAENLALREYREPPISNHGLLSIGADERPRRGCS